MPRVPTLDGPRIQEQGLRIQQMDPNAAGGLVRQGQIAQDQVERASSSLVNTLELERRKADQIAILDADQKLSAIETKMLYDPQTGALNAKGKMAFELPDKVLPEFEKSAQEIEESLTSDYQKLSFRKMMVDRQNHINSALNRHVSRETSRYDEEVTKSYVANEMNAAIESFYDPERVQTAIERQRGAIISYAQRNGVSDEGMKQMITETQSKTHSAIVSKLINGGADMQAKAYYEKYRDQIVGVDQVRVEKAMAQGVLMGEAQRESDRIIDKSGGNMQAALEQARRIQDPRKREETVKRVKSRFADMRAETEDANRQAFESAYKIVESNATMDAVPKEILADLSLKSKQALEKRASQLRSGLPVQTDIETYYELEQMAGNSRTRNDFLRTNLLEKRHLLSESDFKHFAQMQKEARSGRSTELDGIQQKGQIINSALAAAGYRVSGQNAKPADIQQANEFKRQVDNLVVERQSQTGKKVTNEELRDIVNNLMTEVVVSGKKSWLFWDKKKRVFELEPTDQAMIKIDDVPKSEIEKISRALRARNQPINNDVIIRMYSEKLNRMKGPTDG